MILLVALGVGAVAGGIARLLLPGRNRLSWAETVIVGIVGAELAAVVANYVLGIDFVGLGIWAIVAAVIGTLIVLPIAELIKARLSAPPPAPTTQELVAGGENQGVEFKASARWNDMKGDRDARLEVVIAKTVAGFLNAEGGTLLVGVDDDGEIVGIENDLRLVRGGDLDRYELWLHDLLGTCLGRNALAQISIGFDTIGTTTVCRVDVLPSPRPVFLDEPQGRRTADFYVRVGNSTRQLLADELLDYRDDRWGRRRRRAASAGRD